MVVLVASRSRIIVEIHVEFVSRVDMDSNFPTGPKRAEMFKQRKNLTSISYGMNSSFRLHRPSVVTLTCSFELVKDQQLLVPKQ